MHFSSYLSNEWGCWAYAKDIENLYLKIEAAERVCEWLICAPFVRMLEVGYGNQSFIERSLSIELGH